MWKPSRHAVFSYRERVKPGLSMRAARRDLLAVLEHAEKVDDPPEWARRRSDHEGAYLMLADLCFPVARDGTLKTCLVRGGLSDAAREERRALKPRRVRERPLYLRGRRWREGRPREEHLC